MNTICLHPMLAIDEAIEKGCYYASEFGKSLIVHHDGTGYALTPFDRWDKSGTAEAICWADGTFDIPDSVKMAEEILYSFHADDPYYEEEAWKEADPYDEEEDAAEYEDYHSTFDYLFD